MIDETFLHCPGIGPKWDSKLKELGYRNWQSCLLDRENLPVKGHRRVKFLEAINESSRALEEEDIACLVDRFPNREQWRILKEFLERGTFFDIETTGLYWYESHATVISALKNGELHTFLHGENLDEFLDLVDESEFLVSFNGNCFDIPFLEQTFHIPAIECPHIDLRWVAYHKGFRGGLKHIEKMLDIQRPEEVADIDGFEAVDLYHRWLGGDLESLNQLVRYCSADVVATYLVARELCFPAVKSTNDRDQAELFQMAMAVV